MASAGPAGVGLLEPDQIAEWLEAPPWAVIRPFRLPGPPRDIGDELLKNTYRLQHHPPVTLADSLSWTEDPLEDRNWEIWFHSLIPVSYLAQAFERTGNTTYLNRARIIVESWISAHIDGGHEHAMTWHDHAIALRTLALLEFAEVWRRANPKEVAFSGRLLSVLHRHGCLLTDPEIYQPAHNHGIDQDRALLSLAVLIPQWPESGSWRQLAWTRLLTQIREGISEEGVHFEHSPEYEGLVYLMLAQTRDFLAAHALPHDELSQAAESLHRKIAFTLRPDGTWPAVGDSVSRRSDELLEYLEARPESGAEALYALTGGERGSEPASDHLVLPASGCAIFRERWDRSHLKDSLHCYFTAAFNTRTHKHHDDLSFSIFAFGRDVLVDAGRHSYNYSDPHRRYCESVFGHNVVIVDGVDTDTRRLNVGKSGISSTFSARNFDGIDAVHYLYPGIESRRLLLYFHPNIFVVLDRLTGDREFSAVQQFLFAPEWNIECLEGGPPGIRASLAGSVGASPSVEMVQLLAGAKNPAVVRGGHDPLVGWVSRRHGEFEPCSAVHCEAFGRSVAFVTAFRFDPVGKSAARLSGSATWNGRELQCVIQSGGSPIEFVFTWEESRARVVHPAFAKESCVWPTPYEFDTRQTLSGAPRAMQPGASNKAPELPGMPPLAQTAGSNEVLERLHLIAEHVEQLEQRHRRTSELLDQNLHHVERGMESIKQKLIDSLMQRFEEMARTCAQLDLQAAQGREKVTQLERAAEQLRERLTRTQQVANNRLSAISNRQTKVDRLLARIQKLEAAQSETGEKLIRAREASRWERQRFMHAQDQLWDTMNSVRWRLGNAFVLAAKPSVNTLKLPVRLLKLVREGVQRTRARTELEQTTAAPALPGPGPAKKKPGTTAKLEARSAKAKPEATVPTSSVSIRIDPAERLLAPAACRAMRVACVLDEFSFECFEPEAHLKQLTPEGWQAEIEEHRPAFLFVESAWRGIGEKWRHLVSTDRRTSDGPLKDLVDYCRRKGIPTVFWNKEDPANYEHFIKSAVWFDHILTTDSDCIERYAAAAGHNRVGVLPFAAQPRIHNPIGRRGGELGDVCFAGTWYAAKHDGRREDAELVLEPALDFDLHIYDRMHGYKGPGWQNYHYPPQYQAAIRGGLPYEEMLAAYKRYHVFLNVNSVRTSPTMCSRRVFEILACGTNVISAYAPAIENMLGNECIFQTRSKDETRAFLQSLLGNEAMRNQTSVRAIRKVMAEHTYARRFAEVLGRLGLSGAAANEKLTCVFDVASTDDVRAASEFMAGAAGIEIEAIWLKSEDALAVEAPGIVIDAARDRAAAISEALSRAGGEYTYHWTGVGSVTPEQLSDLLHAFTYYGGDLVCRPTGLKADQLFFTEGPASTISRSLLRTSAARRLGPAAFANDSAFADAVGSESIRSLATDTVGDARLSGGMDSGGSRTAQVKAPMPAAAGSRPESSSGNGSTSQEKCSKKPEPYGDIDVSWLPAERAQNYRFVLNDCTDRSFPFTQQVSATTITVPGHLLDPSHEYRWRVELLSGNDRDWEAWVPYIPLRRAPASPAALTRLSWDAHPENPVLYRVILRDDSGDTFIAKDVVSALEYSVDWSVLDASHVHRFRVQRKEGQGWIDHTAYRPINPPVSVLLSVRSRVDQPVAADKAKLLFLFTCDTEANLRMMRFPDRSRGIQDQVFCVHEGREYGINMMMDMLDRHKIVGTFFIDILMEHHLGREGLERVIDAIKTRGHDLQLHLHHSPNLWYAADRNWTDALVEMRNKISPDMFRRFMEHAADLFEKRVGRKAVAFRNGSYFLHDSFIPILREFDLRIDSTLYPFKNFYASPWLSARTQPFMWDGILEVPVSWLVYRAGEDTSSRQYTLKKADLTPEPSMKALAATAGARPRTVVAMAHSYTLLYERRHSDSEIRSSWNARLRADNSPEIYQKMYIAEGVPMILFDGPDEERIGSLARMLSFASSTPGAVGISFQQLNDHYYDVLAKEDAPADPVAVYDTTARRSEIIRTRKYSEGYLARLEAEYQARAAVSKSVAGGGPIVAEAR